MNTCASRFLAGLITILLLTQTLLLSQAMLSGQLLQEGKIIAEMPWGQMTLIDLYSGLILWSILFLVMDRHFWRGILWGILVLLLGHPIACIWLLVRWWQADGNWFKALTPARLERL